MEIPTSGIVNRYIAAQGPLPHTIADFWQVVWEQSCNTVVMLTATAERGRIKCSQYWPPPGDILDLGPNSKLTVKCIKETETSTCTRREFLLKNKEVLLKVRIS